MSDFCGVNLRVARCAGAYSLDEVAERVGKTRQYIHKLETGAARPTEELSADLAASLDVLPEFFYGVPITPIPEDTVHFRRLASTKAGIRQVVIAKGQLTRLLVEQIEQRVALPTVRFETRPTLRNEDIELAAESTRRACGLQGNGPILNVARLAENAGAVVTTFPDVSREVDALCVPGRRPLIITNGETKSACRTRFDIAHEIAHLVMHEGIKTGDRLTESEANRFASALLMPRSAFIKELKLTSSGQIKWAALPELKYRWRVSKAAIIMRAKHLGVIDDIKVRSAFIRLKNAGEALGEVEDEMIEQEQPELVRSALELLAEKGGLSVPHLATAMRVAPALLSRLLPTGNLPGAAVALPANVIPFRATTKK